MYSAFEQALNMKRALYKFGIIIIIIIIIIITVHVIFIGYVRVYLVLFMCFIPFWGFSVESTN